MTSLSVCLAEVHADDGRVGYGLTAITEEEVVAAIINEWAPTSENDTGSYVRAVAKELKR